MSPDTGIALEASPPADDASSGGRLLLSLDEVDELSLEDWQRGVDMHLPRLLQGHQLLDLQLMRLAGQPGVRRLVSHLAEDGRAMTLEQWAVIVRGTGYTVSATCETLAWPTQGPVLARVAMTLSPLGRR
ncbi:MAG: hypothetical protein ACXVWZ_04370 [Nocardioides sp.]